jgi:hypothetical protein
MTPECLKSPLLDGGSLGTFLQQRTGFWENQTVATKLTHVSAATDKHRIIEGLLWVVNYVGEPKVIKGKHVIDSCECGVEYLHLNPESVRRR